MSEKLQVSVHGGGTLGDAIAYHVKQQHRLVGANEAEIAWICEDTPILADHQPDVLAIERLVCAVAADVQPGTIMLISSQVPIGTTRRLSQAVRSDLRWAHSPENVRAKTAVTDFARQSRIVVGMDRPDDSAHDLLERLLYPFTGQIVWMRPEDAECVKHALNCYLAMCIDFGNEMADFCAAHGADGTTVMEALRLDPRIAYAAPIRPGGPYATGHLEREVYNVTTLARAKGLDLPLMNALKPSNDRSR